MPRFCNAKNLRVITPFPTFAGEFKMNDSMDNADFTFLVTSFLYMVLTIVERLGFLPNTLILDFAFAFLWGILLITTGVKARFYLQTANKPVNVIGVILALLVFVSSIVLIFINHYYY